MTTPSLTHSVSEPILTKLGDVIASFALMEQSLKHLVAALASADEQIGIAVCAEVPTKTARMMALSLYLVHFGEDEPYVQLVELMRRVDAAEQQRNQIAHSWWDGFGSHLLDPTSSLAVS